MTPTELAPNGNGAAAKATSSVRRPVRVSPRIGIPLAIVMAIFSVSAFTGLVGERGGPGLPVFVTIRHPETDSHFINWRLANTPLWLYQGLHAAPALTWSMLMPLQHVDSIRKKWPSFHRANGYILLTGSFVLSMSGYYILIKHYAHTHPNPWHIHNLNGLSPIGWPTFEASLWALAPFYSITLIQTARTARAKQYARHRQWAVAHTMFAAIIALERVGFIIINVIGEILRRFPEDKMLEFLQIPNTVAGKASAELDLFAFANIFAAVTALSWITYEWGQAGHLPSIRWRNLPTAKNSRVKTE